MSTLIKGAPFDDLLYHIWDHVEKARHGGYLAWTLAGTTEAFMINTMELYDSIMENGIIGINAKKRSGFTTSIYIVAAYMAINEHDVFMVVPPPKEDAREKVRMMLRTVYDICKIKHNFTEADGNGINGCKMSIMSDKSFNVESMRGLLAKDSFIVVDSPVEPRNISKTEDLIMNIQARQSRAAINFALSKGWLNLMDKRKITIKEINAF